VRLGKVVTEREVPSYVTAACSFEFIFLSVQNTNCISKQLTSVTCFDLDDHIYCSQLLCTLNLRTDLREKYRNLIWGHYIVLLLETEKAKFPVFRTAN